VNGGDVGGRLDAFLEWVREGGIAAARFPAWRPVAEQLIALAGAGRILEGHILSLIDASQGSPGQVALIEEVGEAMLRYQALAKPADPKPTREMPKARASQRLPTSPGRSVTGPISTPPPPSRAPASRPTPTPTPAPRAPASRPIPAPAPASAQRDARPTHRLRPPVPMPGEKLVSFEAPSSPGAPVPTPPPSMAVGSSPPPSTVTGETGATSNVHFRCPKCKMMVAANDDGVCPTCGTRPPTKVVIAVEAPEGLWWKRAAVAGGVVALAMVLWLTIGARVVDHLAHPAVVGSYPARSVGLEATFQEGWRRHAEGQANLGALGIDEPMAVARFTRDDGDLALASAARPADFNDARLAELADAGPDKVAVPLHALADGVRLERCLAEGRRLRCLGSDGDRAVAAYVLLLPKRVAVVVLRSTHNLEETAVEGDALVESLKPL
jgi:hypothetical protein